MKEWQKNIGFKMEVGASKRDLLKNLVKKKYIVEAVNIDKPPILTIGFL